MDPVDNGCMREVAGFNLNCTANDVRLATATNIVESRRRLRISQDDTRHLPEPTSKSCSPLRRRHDIGIYLLQ